MDYSNPRILQYNLWESRVGIIHDVGQVACNREASYRGGDDKGTSRAGTVAEDRGLSY